MNVSIPSLGLLLAMAPAFAHEGDAEDRAMRLHGVLRQLDRQIEVAARETDVSKRALALRAHGELLLDARRHLREAADRSPCVMMESNRTDLHLACLVDTEARLRATDRLLEHLLRRELLREENRVGAQQP